jgi:hypothetical protein
MPNLQNEGIVGERELALALQVGRCDWMSHKATCPVPFTEAPQPKC